VFFFYSRITTVDPVIPSEFSHEVADLITNLLDKDPRERLGCGTEGVDAIKRHPFFKVSSMSMPVIPQ
jgi:serine/threonine protein kinase